MKIEIERQVGGATTFVTTIGGRKVRATTRNGVKGAQRIFDAIGSGVRQSSPIEFSYRTDGDT